MRLLLSLFIACTVSALTPIGAVHELLQHAIELPDGRMLVLTPQRLVLLNSAADKTVGASHWCPSPGFYRAAFTVHDGHAFVPTKRSIQVIRIGEEELEQVGTIDISYAWAVSPIIENGHLYSMRGQRELRIFDLADLSAPQQVAALDFKTSGHSFAIVKGHIYIADKNQLQIFDISTPAQPRRIELDLRLAGDLFGAMHVDGDKLYSFTDKGLNILNITDPAVPTLSEFHKKVSIADRVLKQGNEWLAFYGSGGLELVPSKKDGLASERLAYSWRVETTSDPVKVVADFAAAGLFTNRQLAGGAVLDDLLVLFDGAKAHVFDVA
ncbi:MAG: hypothetical protein ACI8W8_002005, partial [Rhodothermales bacterium]